LRKLLGGDREVADVSLEPFSSQYKGVVEAVGKAGNGQVKVFRVELGGTRAEYYVVAVDEKEGRVVGLKALSVES
jgi:predicted aspartyl protease